MALLSHQMSNAQTEPDLKPYTQSASLLPFNLGKTLDKSIAAFDAFYALTDFFRLVSSSENQFLNMMECKILAETGLRALEGPNPTLMNLLHSQDILDTHAENLLGNVKIIENRGGSSWPKTQDSGLREKTDAAANLLLEDFEHLLHRATTLSARCESGINFISNNAVFAESKRANFQAKKVEQLTKLAFIYIPFSFTTSFFGMNLGVIYTGTLDLWVWAAVSIPIFLGTLAALIWDPGDIAKGLFWFLVNWSKSPRKWGVLSGAK